VAVELGLPAMRETAKPFLHVSGMFPVERGCLAVMWPLASHPTNKNELLAWDLAHDPSELRDIDADTLRLRLFTRTADLPEGVTRIPVKGIHLNKSPMVVGNLRTLAPAMAERWGVDLDTAMRHAAIARDLPDMSAIWSKVYARPKEETPDVDEDLYGGFVGNADRRRLNQLRGLSPEELAKDRTGFDDGRLDEILFRYRARNWPELLSEEENERWEALRVARLFKGEGGARTIEALFSEVDALSENADERGEEILGALYEYAEAIAPEA
jgi:exodeoxyribonuclease I